MSDPNKHGLTREMLRAETKRQIRQACGFGCVICGDAICDYEHFDPPFEDAERHDPNGMALLCGRHHTRKTRGRWSPKDVRRGREQPRAKQDGFARDFLSPSTPHAIVIGGVLVQNCWGVLNLAGDPLIWFDPPEEEGAPVRLTAHLHGPDGEERLAIVQNELHLHADNWDIEIVGPLLTIRDGLGDIVLEMRTEGAKPVQIERLRMTHRQHSVECLGDELRLNGGPNNQKMVLKSTRVGDQQWALRFEGGRLRF